MKAIDGVVARIDTMQQRNRVLGPAYALLRKYGDDDAGLLVVALGWYGFTAIYPLLLAVVTVFAFIGVSSLGHGLVSALQSFPVVGGDFTPGRGGHNLHGNALGLVVGVAGLLYGAQGVTQTAQTVMARVWDAPRDRRPGFLPRLLRSVSGLAVIALAFVFNGAAGSFIAAHGGNLLVTMALFVGLLAGNVLLYLAAFLILTPPGVASARTLVPGSLLAGSGFTILTTIGTGLVRHQLENTSNTYGAFGSVIGVVTFLLLLSTITVYGAELNTVLAQRLWPRSMRPQPEPEPPSSTEAAAPGVPPDRAEPVAMANVRSLPSEGGPVPADAPRAR